MSSSDQRKTRDDRLFTEQTWFAATAGTMNGFLLNGMKSIGSPWIVKALSVLISLYAAFLVLQRSATAEGLFDESLPQVPGEQRHETKWRETRRNFRVVRGHVPFVLREVSGALFYLLLITVSCVAVLMSHPE